MTVQVSAVNCIHYLLFCVTTSVAIRMTLLRASHQILATFNSFLVSKQSASPASRVLCNSYFRRTMATAMAKRLEGKTVVVTGASAGIGRSTAMEFARTSPKNLKLILTARRIDTLKEIAEQIKKEIGEGVKVLPVKLDVSKPEEVRNFVGSLPDEFKEIDVLVNNAYAFTRSRFVDLPGDTLTSAVDLFWV